MAVIEGFVSKIVFSNRENGYAVFVMETEGDDASEQTVSGTFPGVDQGDYLRVEGEVFIHPTYGPQIKATSFTRKRPEDEVSVLRYLASGAVKGIGPVLAAKIVKKFGNDTFRVLEEEPELLAKVKGISEKKAREIAEVVAQKKDMRQAMIFLQNFGITLKLAAKIYDRYGSGLYGIIKTNPYKLAEDIDGVGFKTADEIAAKAGIVPDSDFRIQCGTEHVLKNAGAQGNTYLPKSELLAQAAELLMVEPEAIERNLMQMQLDRRIIIRGDQATGETKVFLAFYFYMEMNVAGHLRDLNIREDVPDASLERQIDAIEREKGLELDSMQREAVKAAVTHGLTVITGGPGTGKTTTINAIISFFEKQRLSILLAAPTGRAAKRMSETTGHEASTIHRMLELSGSVEEGGRAVFARNEENPLKEDAIIIDEMSMVDISLMNALLKAVIPGTRLILVGDADQLPSVGPGRVLGDIIDSECFTVVKLNRIFRQAQESDIIMNAHKINDGEQVEIKPGSKDFLFVKRYSVEEICPILVMLVRDKLPKYVGAPVKDVQVLTPMRKGSLGVEALNKMLQFYLNPQAPDKTEKENGDTVFREGDKVMQIKNDYQMEWTVKNRAGYTVSSGMGIFNGDVGIIREINLYAETVDVEFDEGRMAQYNFKQLDELELAYACTIHKSQGSEYPAVVLPLLAGPRPLMNRNLLYTAVTRAKQCVTVLGSPECFAQMIASKDTLERYSGLIDRLKEV